MSYKAGRMGIANGVSLILVITFPFVFLSTPSQSVEVGAGLAWLMPLIGSAVTVVMLLAVIHVMGWAGSDLYDVCLRLFGKAGAWLVALYYIGLFFADVALLLRQFAENTLLTALPYIDFGIVVLVYISVAGLIVYFGIEGFLRANYIILPFGIFGFILVLLLLIPFYNVHQLAPWQGTGLENVIPAAFKGAGLNAGVFALVILAPSFQSLKTVRSAALYGLAVSGFLKSSTVAAFLMVFGPTVAQEKVLPFFEMTRLVYLSRYIQRIESLFIILWVMAGVLAIAANLYLGLYLITRLLKLPTIRPLIPTVCIILAEIAMIPPDIVTVILLDELIITTYFNIGIYLIPSAIIIFAMLNKKKRRAQSCAGS